MGWELKKAREVPVVDGEGLGLSQVLNPKSEQDKTGGGKAKFFEV